MSARPDQLSWENFRTTVFLPGEQRVHRVIGDPIIEIFGDGLADRIGMWIEVPEGTSIPTSLARLAVIKFALVDRGGRQFIQVSTSSRTLWKQFYHFAYSVAERIAAKRQPAPTAIELELRCFDELLEEKALLSTERQVGLIGELLVLQRLMQNCGTEVLDAWLGPRPEPHDFKVGDSELEVKTTVSPRRIHTIHGGEQLVASAGCSLHLVSVVLGPAGSGLGFSLKSLVETLLLKFAVDAERQRAFSELISAVGYKCDDAKHYTRGYELRRPLAVVAIDSNFPAITRPVIQRVLGNEAQRVDDFQYDVNVEGLESEDGSLIFAKAFGNGAISQ